jgi:hypothetical protein
MSNPKALSINNKNKAQEPKNEDMSIQHKQQLKTAIINNLGLIFNEYIHELNILKKRSNKSGDYDDER